LYIAKLILIYIFYHILIMGEKKRVRFNVDSETATLSESEMAFVNIGKEMYQNSLHSTDNLFSWNKTLIQDMQDSKMRDMCVVMYQAITMNNLWGNLEDNAVVLFTTMQKLGYLGEMESNMFRAAVQHIKQITF
jgi:hypothetical protein